MDFSIPQAAIVVVVDRKKALFFENVGQHFAPNLHLVDELVAEANPLTRLQGDDRPGRTATGDRRSAYSETDWHEVAGQQFAEKIIAGIARLCGSRDCRALVIVAPPRSLADLRRSMPDTMKKLIIGELAKDLTHLPVDEIAAHLKP